MRRVTITAQEVGGDIQTVDLYHTAITGSNLITSSVSRAHLYQGVTVVVPDNATTFFAQATLGSGPCYPETGSFTVARHRPNVRFFTVESLGNGQVEQSAPFTITPTTSFSQSVNYEEFTSFNINATSTYPYEFDGWYEDSGASTLISTDNPLSITQYEYTSSLTDSIFAKFTTTHVTP